MTGWRMEGTVLTDLSASIFAACFVILLIFLGLAQRERPEAPAEASAPVEAGQALALTLRKPLSPAEMVDLLHRHGAPDAAGLGIDLFADRAEVTEAGDDTVRVLSSDAVSALLPALARDGRAPPRVYVFANDLYPALREAIAAAGTGSVEMSVPGWLRDPDAPSLAWSPAFRELDGQALPKPAFTQRLAELVAGSTKPALGRPGARRDATAAAAAPPAAPTMTQSLASFWHAFLRRVAIALTLGGFVLAAFIRYRIHDVPSVTPFAGAATIH